MSQTTDKLTAHLLERITHVQQTLGLDPAQAAGPSARLADVLDSMGLVELLALVAEDCQVRLEQIEECVNLPFDTVAALAHSLEAAGIRPAELQRGARPEPGSLAAHVTSLGPSQETWLTATVVQLPKTVQQASAINQAIGRPAGWLESHAGIGQHHVWAEQDPLEAAAAAARNCLDAAGLPVRAIGGLLVTSEAPPLVTGLAAVLHHALGLSSTAVALEIGGACTGFLACLWTAQSLVRRVGPVLVIAVEAPTQFLQLQRGPAGEAAALFGDGAAACLLADRPGTSAAIRLLEVVLGYDGSQSELIRVGRSPTGAVELNLQGQGLATRAVRAMAQSVTELSKRHRLAVADLQGIVAHGGNGRMAGILARRLGLAEDRVWSEVAQTGNLGSASLPVAWAARNSNPPGPVAWTAAGAGLTWGAALTAN